jgi:hypothetical protein
MRRGDCSTISRPKGRRLECMCILYYLWLCVFATIRFAWRSFSVLAITCSRRYENHVFTCSDVQHHIVPEPTSLGTPWAEMRARKLHKGTLGNEWRASESMISSPSHIHIIKFGCHHISRVLIVILKIYPSLRFMKMPSAVHPRLC